MALRQHYVRARRPERPLQRKTRFLRHYGPVEKDKRLEGAATTSVVGAATGALTGSAEAAAIGALAGPIQLALQTLWASVRSLRAENAARVLSEAAGKAGLSPEQMVARAAESQPRAVLAGEVIEIAMRTALDEKLHALAMSLAAGVTDDAMIDRELIVVRALGDLEAPHLQLLNTMVYTHPRGWPIRHPEPGGGPPVLSRAEWDEFYLRKALPNHKEILMSELATLEHHALIELVGVDWTKRTNDAFTGWGTSDYKPEWRATKLGVWFLDRVRGCEEDEEPESK